MPAAAMVPNDARTHTNTRPGQRITASAGICAEFCHLRQLRAAFACMEAASLGMVLNTMCALTTRENKTMRGVCSLRRSMPAIEQLVAGGGGTERESSIQLIVQR